MDPSTQGLWGFLQASETSQAHHGLQSDLGKPGTVSRHTSYKEWGGSNCCPSEVAKPLHAHPDLSTDLRAAGHRQGCWPASLHRPPPASPSCAAVCSPVLRVDAWFGSSQGDTQGPRAGSPRDMSTVGSGGVKGGL